MTPHSPPSVTPTTTSSSADSLPDEEILLLPRPDAARRTSLAALFSSLSLSSLPPPTATRKLIVLDLNGLLCERFMIRSSPSPSTPASLRVGQFLIYQRPHVASFLTFLFDLFDVGVWSSAMLKNITPLLSELLGPALAPKLVFVWSQAECQEDAPLASSPKKPLFLKPMTKIYAKYPKYIDHALLIDDSPDKARNNPAFTAIHPREWTRHDQADSSLAESGYLRDYLARLASSPHTVPRFVEENPFKER